MSYKVTSLTILCLLFLLAGCSGNEPATATPTPSATPQPIATVTPIPATATVVPTDTALPPTPIPPTVTSIPPTATQTPAPSMNTQDALLAALKAANLPIDTPIIFTPENDPNKLL